MKKTYSTPSTITIDIETAQIIANSPTAISVDNNQYDGVEGDARSHWFSSEEW